MIVLFIFTARMLHVDPIYIFLCNLLEKVACVVSQESEATQTLRCRPEQKPMLQHNVQSLTAL